MFLRACNCYRYPCPHNPIGVPMERTNRVRKVEITFVWRGWRPRFKNMWVRWRQFQISWLCFFITIEGDRR